MKGQLKIIVLIIIVAIIAAFLVIYRKERKAIEPSRQIPSSAAF